MINEIILEMDQTSNASSIEIEEKLNEKLTEEDEQKVSEEMEELEQMISK